MAKFEEQGEGVLGDGCRAVGGNVGHHNPVCFRRRYIDDVISRGEHSDIAQPGKPREGAGVEGSLVGHHQFRFPHPGDGFGGGSAVVHLHLRELAQRVPGKVAGVQTVSVEDNKFHLADDTISRSQWRRSLQRNAFNCCVRRR